MKAITIWSALVILIAANTYAQENEPAGTTYAANTSVSSSARVNADIQDQDQDDGQTSKSFSKSFAVNGNDKVTLINQYGSIVVKTWDKKEVRVDIDIKAYSNSGRDAQNLIDGVNIQADKTSEGVLIKTVLSSKGGFFGNVIRNGVSKRRELKINYVLYMPASNPLQVSQEYGNVNLGDFAGATSLKVAYGNLIAGNLSNSNNVINVQYGRTEVQELNTAVIRHEYGSGISIGAVGTLDLRAEYVGINIKNIKNSANIKVEYGNGLTVGNIGGNLLLNAEYAKVNIGNIKGNTVIRQSYSDLVVGNVGKLGLRTEYTNVSIGSINGDASITMDYNRLNVNEIMPACKNFTFKGEYASVNLGFNERYNANFSLQTAYGSFKTGSGTSSRLVGETDETKRYAGKIGNGGDASLSIRSEYGSITFK